jgi:ketosteroid isomerase-like protein
MIGALVIRRGVGQHMVANIESLDAKQLTADWADDVVVEFPGREPIVGKQAAEAFFRAYFATLDKEDVSVTSMALAHPYAFGVANRVLAEAEVTDHFKDGRTLTFRIIYAFDLDGHTTKTMRFYPYEPAVVEAVNAAVP